MSNERLPETHDEDTPYLTKNDNGVWRLSIKGQGELELPEALGKVFRFSLRLIHFRGLTSQDMRSRSRKATHVYDRMDCHTFAAKCLGFPLPIKYLQLTGYSAHRRFFDVEAFKLHSGAEEHALAQLQQRLDAFTEPILVGQIMRSPGDLTHSFLLLRIGNEWLSLEKSGTGGKFNMRHLPDALHSWRNTYGCHIALAPYDTVARRADLHEWYTKTHFSY